MVIMLMKILHVPAKYAPIGKLAAMTAFVAVMVPMRPLGFQAEHYGAVEVGILTLLTIAGFLTALVIGGRWPLLGLFGVPAIVCGLSFVCHFSFIGLRAVGVPAFSRWHLWWMTGGLITGLVALAMRSLLSSAQKERAQRQYVREHGERVLAWIVQSRGPRNGAFCSVMVVFTLDRTIPNLPEYLKDVATRLAEMRFKSPASADEEEVRRLLQSFKHFATCEWSLVPPSFSGGREAYCTSLYAYPELLAEGELSRPYLYALATPDKPNTALEMVAYPADDELEAAVSWP